MTVTDQVNRQIKRESDGLGRLIKVTEQNVASGTLTQETSYTYDAADRLTLVNQGNQTRAFKYDAEGRLLYERIPEQTATINDGTGTMWTTKYTYTDWGAVATKQDARGVVTTYGYDTLHRLTSLSYNTSGAPGVATTPSVTYTYDNATNSATKGLLLAVAVGSVYSESYSYDSFKRVQALTRTMGSRSYTTSYQLDTANQLTQLTYASTRVLNISHDAKGRVSAIGSYLSSVTYNGIGQVTGMSLGNGVTESYGYDANRLQLTSQTATKGATSLVNLTYNYNATAGQMGAGSTAGNAGQLMSVSGTINSTTESASYTYDNLGRLVTSTQSSNLSLNAQRRFAYDRWGNRTGVWDATSGGNQIQSVTLQQSGGVPTNRITSVTTTGTVNYSYDATGNVTNDGAHSYTYDAENRIVSVDAGAAQYTYDQQNRRVKKVIGSSTTHYVWEGAQVLAEHNGSTGAAIADYIYSGSRMVAKVAGLSTQYFLSDRLSVRLTLDASGNVVGRQAHLPFGEDFAESDTQEKHHFTSYERNSETGMDYAVNRYYGSGVGRFATVDPILDVAFQAKTPRGCVAKRSIRDYINQPQGMNRYSYSLNDPINNIDLLGLETYDECVRRSYKECHEDTWGDAADEAMIVLIPCMVACIAALSAPNPLSVALCIACAVSVILDAGKLSFSEAKAMAEKLINDIFRLGRNARKAFKHCLEKSYEKCKDLPDAPKATIWGVGSGGGSLDVGSFRGAPYSWVPLQEFLNWLRSIPVNKSELPDDDHYS